MSVVGDAFSAIKNVLLMQERIEGIRSDLKQTAADLRSLTEKVHELDRRVLWMEAIVQMPRSSPPPRIEG